MLKVLQPPAKPVPFFPRTSHHGVTDYFKGDVFRVNRVHISNLYPFSSLFGVPNIHFQAFSDAGQYENSLFMFYAPWDRASQEARKTLIEVMPWRKCHRLKSNVTPRKEMPLPGKKCHSETPPLKKKCHPMKRCATP